jgi:DNA-binding LytR/AlgR family response regulator
MVYFEGTPLRRVILHTTQQHALEQECIGKLGEYETLLTDKGFLRIQKSFLVNMAHIVKIKSYVATLDTGEKLTVSERNYQQICQRFTLWKGQRV